MGNGLCNLLGLEDGVLNKGFLVRLVCLVLCFASSSDIASANRAIDICILGLEKAVAKDVDHEQVSRFRARLEELSKKSRASQREIVEVFIEELRASEGLSEATVERLWGLFAELSKARVLKPAAVRRAAIRLTELFVETSDPSTRMDRALAGLLAEALRYYPGELERILKFSSSPEVSPEAGFHLRDLVYKAVLQLSLQENLSPKVKRRLYNILVKRRSDGLNTADFILIASRDKLLSNYQDAATVLGGGPPDMQKLGEENISNLDFILRESEALLEEYSWQPAEKREPLEKLISTVKEFKQYEVNLARERARLDDLILRLSVQLGETEASTPEATYELAAQTFDQVAFWTREAHRRNASEHEVVEADHKLALGERRKPETDESRRRLQTVAAKLQPWAEILHDNIYELHELLRAEMLPQQRVQVVEEARRNLALLNQVLKALLPHLKEIGVEDGPVWSEIETLVRSLHRLKYSSEAREFMIFPADRTARDVELVIEAVDGFRLRRGDLSLIPMELLSSLSESNKASGVVQGLRDLDVPDGLSFPQNSGVHRMLETRYEDILDAAEDPLRAHNALVSLELWVEGIMREQTKAAELALSKELSELQRFMAARQAFRMENLRMVLRGRLTAMRTSSALKNQPETHARIDEIVADLRVSPGATNAWRILGPSLSLEDFRAREAWLSTQEIDFTQLTVEQIDYLYMDFSRRNR